MDAIDSDSAYAVVKSFEDGEIIEQSAEVREEEECIQNETEARDSLQPLGVDLDDDLSESEGEDQTEDQHSSQSTKTMQLNPVQKVSQISHFLFTQMRRADQIYPRYTPLLFTVLRALYGARR